MSGLGQPTILVAIHRDPHVERVVKSLRAAPEVNAPQLVFTGNVAQRLERNRDFDRVAIFGKDPLRLHDEVQAEVFALAFGPDTVGLHAERIEIKLVSSPLIVEGVEENADVVVVPDVVALGDVGAYLCGIVETVKRDVDKTRVVTKTNFGAIFRDEIVARLNLVEIFKHDGSLPDFVVELAVDRGWLWEESRLNGIGFFGRERQRCFAGLNFVL